MDVQGLLVDIDGVLTISWQPIDGASDAMAAIRAAGIPVRCVTNTTTRSRARVADALCDAGIDVDGNDILTAPVATAAYLREHHPDAGVFLLNSGDVLEDFGGIRLVEERADVVVVGGAGESFTYHRLNRAFQQLLDGAALVGMHQNLYWRTAAGFELDTGAYLHALEEASGTRAIVLGKPAPDFFEQALQELGVDRAHVAMVGDDVQNDVLAAQGHGIAGVLVRTGKYRPEVVAGLDDEPDHVIDSFADLPALLGLR
jgi:HAD superfamily hydrolase (TIGR01458 family)